MTKTVMLIIISLLFTSGVNADSIRCGSHIIEDGALHNIPTIEEVLHKCGQPDSREGNRLYYKKKGKVLDFDTEGRLMAIHDIETD